MTKICYFSGTGNTLWSAKKIAAQSGGETELINMGVCTGGKISLEAEAVILLFPAYAYGLPVIVRNFVKKAEFRTAYLAVFVSYGTSPGGALAEISRILGRKKITNLWFGRIPAVENYIAMFGPQKQKTIARRIEMQRTATEEAVRCIKERKTNRVFAFRPVSSCVSMLFSLGIKLFYRWYKVTDKCDGCGICQKVCPVAGIVMKNDKPQFTKKCEHCQGCIQWCPQKAILFGRVRSGTPRYHHPEIHITEMFNESSIVKNICPL
ncbi:MAG: EFR1 family ferrodoxin [Treponema sp.]|nr:EFR1 family ferrodoxin [Treponema sp.]